MYRYIFSLVLSVALVASSLTSVIATNSATITQKEYVDYLTERGKEDPEALKVRQQFLALSDGDRQKFIDYMSDPKIMEEMLSTPVPENSRIELHDGDIVIEHKSETKVISETEEGNEEKESKILSSITALFCEVCFAAPTKSFRLNDVTKVELVGIKAATCTAWVQYNVANGKVTAI